MALQTLNYPESLGNAAANGEHYMMLNSFESVNALHSGTTPKSSIALYIPPNAVKTGFSANYEGMEGGALKAAMGAKFAEKGLGALVPSMGIFSGSAA